MAKPLELFLCSRSDGRVEIVESGPNSVAVRLPFAKKTSWISDAILRDGWMLVRGESWLSLRDGDAASATPLPGDDYVRAADPALAIEVVGERYSLIDVEGVVHASVEIPREVELEREHHWMGVPKGQLADGSLVTGHGAFSFVDGSLQQEWPIEYRAVAVLAGRWVVLDPDNWVPRGVAVVDTEDDTLIEMPADPSTYRGVFWRMCPSGDAVAVEVSPWGSGPEPRPVLVVRAGEEPRLFDQPRTYPEPAWIDDRHVLIPGGRKAPITIDTLTGETSERTDLPPSIAMCAPITGRFTLAEFTAAFPPKRRAGAPPEHPLPDDLRAFLDATDEPTIGEKDTIVGVVGLSKEPARVELAVDAEGQDWDVDDPHVDKEGHYEVTAISLVESSEDFDPLGLLVWLPVEGCYGSWDSDHWNITMFPGATWADVVETPGRYVGAQWAMPEDPYLVPVHHHPFVDDDGKVFPPKPPKRTKPTPIGDAERAFAEAARLLTQAEIPEDPVEVTAALERHGTDEPGARPAVMELLCRYVREARPLPPPNRKRHPRPSPGVKAALAAIGRSAAWAPIDLHGSHLHDLRFIGRSYEDQVQVNGGIDLHGCLLTGKTKFLWVEVFGPSRLDGCRVQGELDLGNVDFVGPVSFAGASLEGGRMKLGRYFRGPVDARDLHVDGTLVVGSVYGDDACFDGARITGWDTFPSTVIGTWSMRDAEVTASVGRVDVGAAFGGGLDLTGSRFDKLSLDHGQYTGPVSLRDVTVEKPLELHKSTFGAEVDLTGLVAPAGVELGPCRFDVPLEVPEGIEVTEVPERSWSLSQIEDLPTPAKLNRWLPPARTLGPA